MNRQPALVTLTDSAWKLVLEKARRQVDDGRRAESLGSTRRQYDESNPRWHRYVIGAMGEAAFGIWAGLDPPIQYIDPGRDVDHVLPGGLRVQVKTTDCAHGNLVFDPGCWEREQEADVAVLCTVHEAFLADRLQPVTLVGWAWLDEVKEGGHWHDFGRLRRGWLYPRDRLRPMPPPEVLDRATRGRYVVR